MVAAWSSVAKVFSFPAFASGNRRKNVCTLLGHNCMCMWMRLLLMMILLLHTATIDAADCCCCYDWWHTVGESTHIKRQQKLTTIYSLIQKVVYSCLVFAAHTTSTQRTLPLQWLITHRRRRQLQSLRQLEVAPKVALNRLPKNKSKLLPLPLEIVGYLHDFQASAQALKIRLMRLWMLTVTLLQQLLAVLARLQCHQPQGHHAVPPPLLLLRLLHPGRFPLPARQHRPLLPHFQTSTLRSPKIDSKSGG